MKLYRKGRDDGITPVRYILVDPADLELAAVGVLEEAKKKFRKLRERDEDPNRVRLTWAVWTEAIDTVRNLESSIDPEKLKELRDIQVWAKAWRWALERRYITFSQREECELQAQAELEKGEGHE